MSERERWIVYPLLFLSLGVALRDELFDRTWSKSVVCEQLVAMQENPTNPQDRRLIAAIGPKGGSIDETTQTGQLRVDTVLARNVVAENFAFRGGQMDLVDRILQIVTATLRASAEQWPVENFRDQSANDEGVSSDSSGESDSSAVEESPAEEP